jgi:hypothetical protein
MRGARMGAISARQAITRSTPRRRARLRPRQPARPTSAVRRILPTQAAATFTRATMVGATSTPLRSAPATPACSCCAPVRPVLARPAQAPRGLTVPQAASSMPVRCALPAACWNRHAYLWYLQGPCMHAHHVLRRVRYMQAYLFAIQYAHSRTRARHRILHPCNACCAHVPLAVSRLRSRLTL